MLKSVRVKIRQATGTITKLVLTLTPGKNIMLEYFVCGILFDFFAYSQGEVVDIVLVLSAYFHFINPLQQVFKPDIKINSGSGRYRCGNRSN